MNGSSIWDPIYEVGGVTGDECILIFTLAIVSFLLTKFRNKSIAKIGLTGMAVLLIGVMINSRLETFAKSEILNESTNVIVLEGKLITADIITSYDPEIGEKVTIENVELFRPSPTRHSPSGCWGKNITNSKHFSLGDELRIHYLWLKGEGPTAMVEGERRPLDIPCILKVEKRNNA